MKTVLSIDGGGIRGIIPAVLLAEIERRTERKIFELFDLIAGTSTGGILTLGLSLPDPKDNKNARNSAKDMLDLYLNEGPNIFKARFGQTLEEFVLGEPKYDSSGIDGALSKYFGSTHLSQCLTNTLTTSYDVTARSTCFFKSWDKDFNFYECKQVARATSAAPTYFAPTLVPGTPPLTCIDGGIVANNPAVCAYVEAVRHKSPGEDILFISLGTGNYERSYQYDQVVHWRPFEWLLPMIDFFFDASNMASDYQMRVLSAGGQVPDDKCVDSKGFCGYYRFQTKLDKSFDSLDNASNSNMNALMTLGGKIFHQEQADEFDSMIENLESAQTHRTPGTWNKVGRISDVG